MSPFRAFFHPRRLARIGLLLGWAFLCLAGGCDDVSVPENENDRSTGPVTKETTDGEFPLTFEDGLGRTTTLKVPPQRIVSLAPSVTEILFAVGANEKLVGVTTHCNYPAEAAQIDQVGGFAASSISLEKLVSVNPDLVLVTGTQHQTIIERIEGLDIPVIALVPESIADVARDIQMVGRLTGHKEQADQVVDVMNRRLEEIERKIDPVRDAERVTVFFQVWDQPLMTATRKTFIGEMIERLHAVNVFAELKTSYPQISEEVFLRRNPEVILAQAHSNDETLLLNKIVQREKWSDVSAIRNHRVYLIEDDLIVRSSPRLVDGFEEVARAIYPECFPEMADEPGASRDAEQSQ